MTMTGPERMEENAARAVAAGRTNARLRDGLYLLTFLVMVALAIVVGLQQSKLADIASSNNHLNKAAAENSKLGAEYLQALVAKLDTDAQLIRAEILALYHAEGHTGNPPGFPNPPPTGLPGVPPLAPTATPVPTPNPGSSGFSSGGPGSPAPVPSPTPPPVSASPPPPSPRPTPTPTPTPTKPPLVCVKVDGQGICVG